MPPSFNTALEVQLWRQLQVANARIAELEADRGLANARRQASRVKPEISRLSPRALERHRQQCAARARLFRARLSLRARRKILAQARALGVVPDGFDEAAFLDGAHARDAMGPSTRGSTGATPRRSLLVEEPDDVPGPRPSALIARAWKGLRLAKIEGGLSPHDEEQLERLVHDLRAGQGRRGVPSLETLRYEDGRPAVDGGNVVYPNGKTMFGFGPNLSYPSGRPAISGRQGVMHYPDGRVFNDGDGRLHSADGRVGTLDDLVRWIRAAAPELSSVVRRGIRRLERTDLVELAAMELAWVVLRAN